MANVKIQGWRVGFNKVACTNIVRAAGSLDLAEAKAVTDSVLAGHLQIVQVLDESTAQLLAKELTEIGAIATVSAA